MGKSKGLNNENDFLAMKKSKLDGYKKNNRVFKIKESLKKSTKCRKGRRKTAQKRKFKTRKKKKYCLHMKNKLAKCMKGNKIKT